MTGRLIILSGEAGAGKDSLAKVLVEQHGFRMFSLSDEMKKFAMRIFGWKHDRLYGPSHMRNEPDPAWARPCPRYDGTGYVRVMRRRKCWDCDGAGELNDNSARRVLQLLGDEWGRQMIHPDIWTLVARPKLERLLEVGFDVVVNDARFSNDRSNLAERFDGKRVDVRRPVVKMSWWKQFISSLERPTWRSHASETSQPNDDEVEHVLINDEEWPFPNLAEKTELMLEELFGVECDVRT